MLRDGRYAICSAPPILRTTCDLNTAIKNTVATSPAFFRAHISNLHFRVALLLLRGAVGSSAANLVAAQHCVFRVKRRCQRCR